MSPAALGARDEPRRALDLRPLLDLDLRPPPDDAVSREMACERPRRRPGRGVLDHAEARPEHPELPGGAVAGEAVRADRPERGEGGRVRPQRRDRLAASERDVDVA